jgi:hypothetical protein
MPPHLDTLKKCKILGAKEFLDFFKTKADGEGKVGIRKLQGRGPATAECFGISRQNVAKIVKSGRERRHFKKGEEKRGGPRCDAKARLAKEQTGGREVPSSVYLTTTPKYTFSHADDSPYHPEFAPSGP